MADQICDFCGASFTWTEDQVRLDLHLRLRGSGLGACCSECDDKMIAIEIRNMEAEDRREAEELAEEERAEMDAFFRAHPHG